MPSPALSPDPGVFCRCASVPEWTPGLKYPVFEIQGLLAVDGGYLRHTPPCPPLGQSRRRRFSPGLASAGIHPASTRPLHFLYSARHLAQQSAGTPAAGRNLLLDYSGLAGQLGKVLGRLYAVGWIGILNVAVRGDALVGAVADFAALELVNVLANQVALDAVAGDERQRLLQDFQFAEAGNSSSIINRRCL